MATGRISIEVRAVFRADGAAVMWRVLPDGRWRLREVVECPS